MIDETIPMIPGPTPVHPRILAALARPTTSHMAPDFQELFRRCLADLKEIVFTAEAQPFLVAGGGTLAMEMALVNTVAPGQRILILSQGYFGDRFAELAGALGIEFELVQSSWGRIVPPEELQARLAGGGYAAVTITHVDTATGACAPVEQYVQLLRGRDELVILDGVCATGGIAERLDDWGVDVLLTAPQKAFGAPPGLAITLFSERAMERRSRLGAVAAYYADVMRWLPIMEDPGRYYSTPAVNQFVAMAEATRIVLEEGLEERFARHARLAGAARSGLEALGMQLYTAPDALADTLSLVSYPEGIEDGRFLREMAGRGVVVAGALGPIKGRAFRLGHMGNIGPEEICKSLDAVEGSLRSQGFEAQRGVAVAAAAEHLQE